jgi:hypothetical protein
MAKSHRSYRVFCSSTLAVALAFGIGCSSSDKPAPAGGAATSIDQNKVLSSLSTSEMQTLCSDFKNYLVAQTAQEFAARVCIQSGFTAAAIGTAANPSQACHDSYNSCMNDPAPKTSAGIQVNALCPSSPAAPSCSMSVSQFVACLDQLIDAAKAAWALKNDLCDNLASCTGLCSSPLTLPAACTQINTTCPGLTPQVVSYVTVS